MNVANWPAGHMRVALELLGLGAAVMDALETEIGPAALLDRQADETEAA